MLQKRKGNYNQRKLKWRFTSKYFIYTFVSDFELAGYRDPKGSLFLRIQNFFKFLIVFPLKDKDNFKSTLAKTQLHVAFFRVDDFQEKDLFDLDDLDPEAWGDNVFQDANTNITYSQSNGAM